MSEGRVDVAASKARGLGGGVTGEQGERKSRSRPGVRVALAAKCCIACGGRDGAAVKGLMDATCTEARARANIGATDDAETARMMMRLLMLRAVMATMAVRLGTDHGDARAEMRDSCLETREERGTV